MYSSQTRTHTHTLRLSWEDTHCLHLVQLFIFYFIFCVIANVRVGRHRPQLKEIKNHFTFANVRLHLETELVRCLM